MNINIIILFFLLIIIYYVTIKNKIDKDEINLSNINIEKKKKKKIQNPDNKLYNIKEYDYINNNIIIHNKFKNELVEFRNNKHKILKYIQLKEEEKNNNINNKIKNNSMQILIKELNIKLEKEKKELIFLENNIKKNVNNFLNDYKNKKIKPQEFINFKTKIKNNIVDSINYIKCIDKSDIENKEFYKQPAIKKIKILNEELKLLNNITN